MYLIIYFLFIVLIIFYLLVGDSFTIISQTHKNSDNEIILFLTQHTQRVEKDYTIPPEGLSKSRYNVKGTIINNSYASMQYPFPLIMGKVSNFKTSLKPHNVSALVDEFGVNSPYVSRTNDGIKYVIPENDPNEFDKFKTELSAGSWHIDEYGTLSVDYKKIIQNHQGFCVEISNHILKELKDLQADSYFNRVQAVLNFVQHIPYGQPTFDKNNFNYLGLALPPESFVLNYSDCDSKSIFFASILSNLIQSSNIVLVECFTTENHMMVAVKGLNIHTGEHVECDSDNFLLLETTTPCVIGNWHWDNFELKKIVKLA